MVVEYEYVLNIKIVIRDAKNGRREASPQQPGGSTKILKQSVSDQNASRFQRTTHYDLPRAKIVLGFLVLKLDYDY